MIETTLDSARRLVVIRMTGAIRAGELLAAREGGRTNPVFPPGFRQLIDLGDATEFDLSSAAVESLASSSSVVPGTKRAIVAPRDLPYGMSRIFAVFAERHGHDVRVFRSLDEAMSWLDD